MDCMFSLMTWIHVPMYTSLRAAADSLDSVYISKWACERVYIPINYIFVEQSSKEAKHLSKDFAKHFTWEEAGNSYTYSVVENWSPLIIITDTRHLNAQT